MRDPWPWFCWRSTVCTASPISYLAPHDEDSEEECRQSVYAQARVFEHEQEHEHEQPISQQALAEVSIVLQDPLSGHKYSRLGKGWFW